MRHSVAGVLAALFVLAQAHAQEKPADKPKWDVNAPQGATLKQVAIMRARCQRYLLSP